MGTRGAAAGPTGAKQNILVVEDEVPHLRALDNALTQQDYSVTAASSVLEALEAINGNRGEFHGAVVDYELLDRTGVEVVKALCAAEHYTASILLTGLSSNEVIEDSLRAGVHAFLTKPVPLDKLLPALTACVGQTLRIREQRAQAAMPRPPLNGDTPIIVGDAPSPYQADYGYILARASVLALRGGLSDRERQVLVEVFKGQRNAEIGHRLSIAERTVKFHISNINRKLNVGNRSELMARIAGDAGAVNPVAHSNDADAEGDKSDPRSHDVEPQTDPLREDDATD